MFPQFNIHSTPLAILVFQGLIFAVLLLLRYKKEGRDSDLIIALILILMAYHRTTYTIGFMGWYDTFKNTKINYFLFSLAFAVGPLIYLYVRTTVVAPFKLHRRDLWHFLPVSILFVYRVILLIHDAQQENWDQGYEGELLRDFHLVYVEPILSILQFSSQLLYLAFTIQIFVKYRSKIKQFFSSTYRVELNWIMWFLIIYVTLFAYGAIIDAIDAFVMDLDYVHVWWIHLFSAIAIVYLGIKAYFTDIDGLQNLTFDLDQSVVNADLPLAQDFIKEKDKITRYMGEGKAYLDPDLNLKSVATNTKMSIHEVSEVINSGYGMNFNEWVNHYRVEEVKRQLTNEEKNHLSLVAIAHESGFNSKATFNRVFKNMTGMSPSEYRRSTKK